MTAQLQYRRTATDQNNIFPTLAGTATGSSLAVPVSLNIQHKRTTHNVTANYSRTTSDGLNQYAFVQDVAGAAGIGGVSTDPFDWGVPQLSFSGLTGVRDVTPSRRTDERFSLGYGWTRPVTTATRCGSAAMCDSIAPTTGPTRTRAARSSSPACIRRAARMTCAAAGSTSPTSCSACRSRRRSSTVLATCGCPDSRFSAYCAGRLAAKQHTDVQPRRALRADLAVLRAVRTDGQPRRRPRLHRCRAGRLGRDRAVHRHRSRRRWSTPTRTTSRRASASPGGCKPGHDPPRRLRHQLQLGLVLVDRAAAGGAAAVRHHGQRHRHRARPADPVESVCDRLAGETTNNYGVDPNYALGLVQTWNADLSRDIRQVWNVGAGYTETRGASLDIVRAPNRGPAGLRIPGVQPFLWQTSEGSSVLHAATFRASRRPGERASAAASPTRSPSRATTPRRSAAAGRTVAQDDQNLAAEWGLSSFDRRHQLSANLNVELPFGAEPPVARTTRPAGRRSSATGASRRTSRCSRGRRSRRA